MEKSYFFEVSGNWIKTGNGYILHTENPTHTASLERQLKHAMHYPSNYGIIKGNDVGILNDNEPGATWIHIIAKPCGDDLPSKLNSLCFVRTLSNKDTRAWDNFHEWKCQFEKPSDSVILLGKTIEDGQFDGYIYNSGIVRKVVPNEKLESTIKELLDEKCHSFCIVQQSMFEFNLVCEVVSMPRYLDEGRKNIGKGCYYVYRTEDGRNVKVDDEVLNTLIGNILRE
jgi:hypothetical protein